MEPRFGPTTGLAGAGASCRRGTRRQDSRRRRAIGLARFIGRQAPRLGADGERDAGGSARRRRPAQAERRSASLGERRQFGQSMVGDQPPHRAGAATRFADREANIVDVEEKAGE